MLAPGVLVKCLLLSKNKRGENKFPEDLFKYDAKITGLNRTLKIWLREVQRSSGRAQATRQRPSGRNLWTNSPLSDCSARSLRAKPGPGRRGLRWVLGGGTFQQRQFPVCSPQTPINGLKCFIHEMGGLEMMFAECPGQWREQGKGRGGNSKWLVLK